MSVSAAAVRPLGPAAAAASAPSFTLLPMIEFAPFGFITKRTKSVAWPPNWNPMLAPSSANSAGALQRPVKCSPVRHVIAPRPKSPPMPIANFRTDGITITHSALLSRSFGIPSGMFMISFNTWPHVSSRFCSLLSFAAKVGQPRNMATIRTPVFLMTTTPKHLLHSHVGIGRSQLPYRPALSQMETDGFPAGGLTAYDRAGVRDIFSENCQAHSANEKRKEKGTGPLPAQSS